MPGTLSDTARGSIRPAKPIQEETLRKNNGSSSGLALEIYFDTKYEASRSFSTPAPLKGIGLAEEAHLGAVSEDVEPALALDAVELNAQSYFAWLWPIACEGGHEAARHYLQHSVAPVFSK